MKKIVLLIALTVSLLPLCAQSNKADQLQDLESKTSDNQNVTATATTKSATRLFGEENDLTTVIMVIPAGSTVNILGSDSSYYHVTFEENDGYIVKRSAVIDKTPVSTTQTNKEQQNDDQSKVQENQNDQPNQTSRFSYLENKYGTSMAARLNAGKIWKGMSAEMVKDSWGTPQKTDRVISGNTIKETWVYKNTWLYLENNVLVDWGPVKN